jgi:hypothetical protein
LALALLVLIVRQLAGNPTGDLIVGPDWRGPLYSLQIAGNMFFRIFQDLYFGTDFPFSYIELLLATAASPNPPFVNLMLVAIPIPLSALTAYLFTLTRIRRDEHFAVVAALLYSVNPLTVSRLYSVEVLMLWVYALLPLFLFFAIDFKKRRSILLAAFVLNLMFALRPQALDILALMLIGPLVSYLVPLSKLRTILQHEGKSLARAIGFLTLTFIPLSGIYVAKLFVSQTVSVTTSDVIYLYSNAGPWNALRLTGEPSFYHAIFDLNDPFSILSLVALVASLVLIASSFLLDRSNHAIRTWQYSFLATLSILTLAFVLRDALANFIVSSPVTGALRNPDKFLFALALPMSVVVAHALNSLRLRAPLRLIRIPQWNEMGKTLMIGLVIALILVQNYPLVTANLYSSQNQPSIRNSYWEDPQSWSRYSSVLDSLGTYRVLVLPYTYEIETAAKTILSAYSVVSIPPGEIGAKAGAVSYWSYLLDSVANNQSYIAYALKMGGIRYVLVDDYLAASIGRPVSLDANFLSNKVNANGIIDNYLYLPPSQLITILNSQRSIRFVETIFGLHIFENMLYEGNLFTGQLVYSSMGGSTNISALLNDSIMTSDQSVAQLASAKLVSPLTTLDNTTIAESRPQILPLSTNASTENIGPTVALANLAYTNSEIVFPSGPSGWASVDVVSPYGFAHQPSGVDQYNVFYKNSSGISTPVWSSQGFSDIILGGRNFPLAVYKSSVGGTSSLEGYSIGAQKENIPPSFNYSSLPGLHKGFKIYLDGLPVTLDLGFYFQLDNSTKLSFGMASYLVNPGSVSKIDVVIAANYVCQLANAKLLRGNLSYNSVQEGYTSSFQGITMGSNSQQYLFLTADNLSTCSGITAWLAPLGLIPRLERQTTQPLKVQDNGAEILATFASSGPSVLFLAYAFDSAWALSPTQGPIHFQCLGMNCFILQSTGTSLLVRFAKESIDPFLFSLAITAAIASLAYYFLWNVRWNPFHKKKVKVYQYQKAGSWEPVIEPQPCMDRN